MELALSHWLKVTLLGSDELKRAITTQFQSLSSEAVQVVRGASLGPHEHLEVPRVPCQAVLSEIPLAQLLLRMPGSSQSHGCRLTAAHLGQALRHSLSLLPLVSSSPVSKTFPSWAQGFPLFEGRIIPRSEGNVPE